MRIVHLSTQDKGGGGGSFDAAYRLHKHLASINHDSLMLVFSQKGKEENIRSVYEDRPRFEKFKYFSFRLKTKLIQYLFGVSKYFYIDGKKGVGAKKIIESFGDSPDVIIVHWVSGFISYKVLQEVYGITKIPILIYMMDMAPMTGGCHYFSDCNRFSECCGSCPQLGLLSAEEDVSRTQWAEKFQFVSSSDVTAVAASSWQVEKLKLSSIFSGARQETILLAADTELFRPTSSSKARSKLGLPEERIIIFFGAINLEEERKGMQYLFEALEFLAKMLVSSPDLKRKICLVSAGKKKISISKDLGFEHRYIGLLRGDRGLSLAYQSADVFVCPSVEDAGPMMINEAILCGTPVVSFSMGVAMDLVHNGRTGYRAKLRDSFELARGLYNVITMTADEYREMSINCRKLGLEKCNPLGQALAFERICLELSVESRFESSS